MKSFLRAIALLFATVAVLFTVACSIPEVNLNFYVDGEVYHATSYFEGTELTFPAHPEKVGYRFIGWYLSEDGDDQVTAEFFLNDTLLEDITLYARFEEKAQFTVTFNSVGGNKIDDVVVYDGDLLPKPQDPTKKNFEFICWMNGDNEWDFNTPVTEDLKLKAEWQKVDTKHTYDHACDPTCNDEGCDHTRKIEHKFYNDCDTDCNTVGCDFTREITHKFTNDCDTVCDVSGCGFTREITHKDNSGDGRCDSCNKIMTLSYAEFLAAADGETVLVEAYIQGLHEWQGEAGIGTASIHAQTEEGGYYFHMLNCSSAEYSTLELGTGIVVRGQKDTYNGEVRVISGEILEILPENRVVVPEDMTDIIDDADELIKHQNRHVYFKNLIFSSIELGYNQYSLKFYYENILYTFILKDSLIDNTSKTSIIAKNLAQGDIVDVSAFLYWNNGATPYISGIKVTSCADKHIDGDLNQSCDKCGEVVCTVHFDFTGDNLCDRCGEEVKPPHVCDDNNGNGYCDDASCNRYMALDDIYWTEDIELIVQINTNSNNLELPDGGKRYLAGEDRDNNYDHIDELVAQRNESAYAAAKVDVLYDYLPDTSNYGWGENVEHIYVQVMSASPHSPDIFVNFIYDMVSASLKGAFANLYSTQRGQGNNYFSFAADPDAYDTGNGYMYEYMRSLTLSKHKMYLVASDYFIDVVRAFTVVPVNVQLMNTIAVDADSVGADESYKYKFNSDRNGDGIFTIDDFYMLVKAGEWNYKTVMEYSNAIMRESGNNPTSCDIQDTVGFALSADSGMHASALLYTSTVRVINRDWDEAVGDFKYYYPDENYDLYDFCGKLHELVSSRGVLVVSRQDAAIYDPASNAISAIREKFAENGILFGGIVMLGALEHQAYQQMNSYGDGGFGIVPVPLYREVDLNTGETDPYMTQIYNVGRIGAISATSQNFEMASAFLEYQSTHSTEILNEYYDYKLSYEIAGGSDGNVEMLQYIRRNIRSSFDSAFEDAIARFFSPVDMGSNRNRWHTMILSAGYKLENMNERYGDLVDLKNAYLESLYNEYDRLPN